MKGIKYSFTGVIWRSNPQGGWYFVDLPTDYSDEIRKAFGNEEEGWGRLKATARIGSTEWKTAIWYDTKRSGYLLPIKAEVRAKEALTEGFQCSIHLWI